MDWVGKCSCRLQVIASAAKQSSHPSPEFLSSHGSPRNSSLSPKGRGESANLFHPTSQSKKCTAAKIKDFLAVTGETLTLPLSLRRREEKSPTLTLPVGEGMCVVVHWLVKRLFTTCIYINNIGNPRDITV